jgi:hypothetical protein
LVLCGGGLISPLFFLRGFVAAAVCRGRFFDQAQPERLLFLFCSKKRAKVPAGAP